jgi:hypothetical protein
MSLVISQKSQTAIPAQAAGSGHRRALNVVRIDQGGVWSLAATVVWLALVRRIGASLYITIHRDEM